MREAASPMISMDLTTDNLRAAVHSERLEGKLLGELDRVAGRDQHVKNLSGLITPHR